MNTNTILSMTGGFVACLALLMLLGASHAPDTSSAVKALSDRDTYYPGSEDLQPDEMRIIACGTLADLRAKAAREQRLEDIFLELTNPANPETPK